MKSNISLNPCHKVRVGLIRFTRCLSVHPSVAPTAVGGFSSYLAQMITNFRRCVMFFYLVFTCSLDALDPNAYQAFQASRNLRDVVDRVMDAKSDGKPGMSKKLSVRATLMTPILPMLVSILVSPCPSVDRILSALYLQQYSSDPFHICTSYQATSEGVSRVMFVSKFKKLKFWRIL